MKVFLKIFLICICANLITYLLLFLLFFSGLPWQYYRVGSSIQADLRNIATAEEAYFTEHGTFTKSVDSLSGSYGFIPTDFVITQVISADKNKTMSW